MSSAFGSAKKRSAAEAERESGVGKESAAKRSREEEESKVPAIKQEETDEEAAALKQDTDDEEEAEEKTVLVEFKFRNNETSVEGGEWDGTIVVPMLQDKRTGLYRLPPTEEIKFQGTSPKCDVYDEIIEFEGCFRRRDGPKSELAFLDLGLDLGVCWLSDERPDVKARVTKRGELEKVCGQSLRTPAYPLDTSSAPSTEVVAKQLQDWERNQGGMLCAWAKASIANSFEDKDSKWTKHPDYKQVGTYKMELQTVLSVERPDARAKHQPDWGALETIVLARFPDKNAEWATRAVKQYRLFLELKIGVKDFCAELYAPSKLVDEVWHAHISFLDVYQRDILSLTNGLHIIEHSPVIGEEARNRYQQAYEDHTERMQGSSDEVDNEFWPDPDKLEDVVPKENADDSGNGVDTGYGKEEKMLPPRGSLYSTYGLGRLGCC